MEKETDSYRVVDERKLNLTIFEGSHDECGDFINENYEESSEDFKHIWTVEYKKEKMNRVFDERHPEYDIFLGSNLECMTFMHTNYFEDSADFNYIWTEPCI